MAFDSITYSLWAVFVVLELAGVRYITNPQLRTIRWFLAFCALRDVLLFAVHRNMQAYWDLGWTSKQVELVWLALIGGHLASLSAGRFERPFRIPAFGVAVLSVFNLPYYSTPALMHDYQWHAQIIILGTVLIGCVLSIERRHLEIAAAMAILALSGIVSAVSFLQGNFSPRTASAVWVAGLCILVVAAKGSAVPAYTRQSPRAT